MEKLSQQTNPQAYHASCKVCNSKLIEQIHELKRNGKTLSEISNFCKKNGESISLGSICRHFSHAKKFITKTADKVTDVLEKESTDLATHRHWTNQVLELTYKEILQQFRSGMFAVSIQDFARLLQLRHLILEGETSAGNDLIKIFQEAKEKYGLSDDQPALFDKVVNLSDTNDGKTSAPASKEVEAVAAHTERSKENV